MTYCRCLPFSRYLSWIFSHPLAHSLPSPFLSLPPFSLFLSILKMVSLIVEDWANIAMDASADTSVAAAATAAPVPRTRNTAAPVVDTAPVVAAATAAPAAATAAPAASAPVRRVRSTPVAAPAAATAAAAPAATAAAAPAAAPAASAPVRRTRTTPVAAPAATAAPIHCSRSCTTAASVVAAAPAASATIVPELAFQNLLNFDQGYLMALLKTIPSEQEEYRVRVTQAITAVIAINTAKAAAKPKRGKAPSVAAADVPCRYGKDCTNKTCPFNHIVAAAAAAPAPGPAPATPVVAAAAPVAAPAAAPVPAPAAASATVPPKKDKSWMATNLCRKGNSCGNTKCSFAHSQQEIDAHKAQQPLPQFASTAQTLADAYAQALSDARAQALADTRAQALPSKPAAPAQATLFMDPIYTNATYATETSSDPPPSRKERKPLPPPPVPSKENRGKLTDCSFWKASQNNTVTPSRIHQNAEPGRVSIM